MWSFTLQIDWKQRFFVPTDEEAGLAVLTDLLSRYPVLASDVLAADEPNAELEPTDLAPPQIVDLDEWLVPVADSEQSIEPRPILSEQAHQIETAEAALALPAFYFARPSQPACEVEELQLALDFG